MFILCNNYAFLEPLAGSLDSLARPHPILDTVHGVRNVHEYDANQQTAIKVCMSKLCVSCELNEKHIEILMEIIFQSDY